MMGLLNLGALVLGLVAWGLAGANLARAYKGHDHGDRAALSIASFSACAVSLCLEFFYTLYLVEIEDWSALMDTTGAMALVASVLVAVTIVLNVLSLLVHRDRTAGRDDASRFV